MLTVADFATKHAISKQRVYDLIKQGRLKYKVDRGVKLILDKKLPDAQQLGRPKYKAK